MLFFLSAHLQWRKNKYYFLFLIFYQKKIFFPLAFLSPFVKQNSSTRSLNFLDLKCEATKQNDWMKKIIMINCLLLSSYIFICIYFFIFFIVGFFQYHSSPLYPHPPLPHHSHHTVVPVREFFFFFAFSFLPTGWQRWCGMEESPHVRKVPSSSHQLFPLFLAFRYAN